MKKACFSLIIILLLIPFQSIVEAHSGRTDSRGGHNCSEKSKAKGLCSGYHYHNGGGGSSSGSSSSSNGSSPSGVIHHRAVVHQKEQEHQNRLDLLKWKLLLKRNLKVKKLGMQQA
ncbi:YHYH domain-containing protein [Ornithinibacillus bavariensis]|uniref:YHYH domain-containing protein n=1 Tax=Ornithinibacillus bavariensis TaxID=545502 RepID=UPI000EC4A180|nr:hypothetical protein [Ornithinibacillus sp.]